VAGFDKDKVRGDFDDEPEISDGILATQSDAIIVFLLPNHLFDAFASLEERFGEMPGNVAPV